MNQNIDAALEDGALDSVSGGGDVAQLIYRAAAYECKCSCGWYGMRYELKNGCCPNCSIPFPDPTASPAAATHGSRPY